jgi:2-C-methyl-D-erythritol 4-phosphate cytidylyltransferase
VSGRTARLAVVPVCHDDPSAPAGCAALRPLRDVPLVRRAVGALLRSGAVDVVVVVAPPALVGPVGALLAGLGDGGTTVEVLAAPENGPGFGVLAALRSWRADPADVVVVHDPLFPLVPAALVRAVVAAIDPSPAPAPDPVPDTVPDPVPAPAPDPRPAGVVPLRPVTDTLKRIDEDGLVLGTVDRAGFRTVCSPQAFRTGALLAALEAADGATLRDPGTDVLPCLVQDRGGRLSSVDAPGEVFRVADADDLVLAEAIVGDRLLAGQTQ